MSGSSSSSPSPTPFSFSCPLRTYWNGTSCNACLQEQFWNGTACLSCPIGYYGNGTFCDSCSAGEFLNITSSSSSLDSVCQPCPIGSISFPSSTSCTCLTCGDTQAVLDTVLKKNINITSIDSAVDVLSQVNLIVDDLSIILSNNSIGSGNSGSSGSGGSGTSTNKTVSNANANAFRSGIITLIGTITNVFTTTADIYVSLRTILSSTNTSFLNSSLSSSTSSNSSTSTTSILANDTSILIPEAVSDVLASNLVILTSNPAQLTQDSASSALESLSDLLTLNLPVNVLSGAVDTIFGGEQNVSNVAPFTTKSATTFLTAINNVFNKFQEDLQPVQVDTVTSLPKENSTNTSDALPLTPLQSIDNTLNILTAVVLRSSNVDSTPISVVSAPPTATFNASINSTTYLSSYCGSALSLTAMRISVPNATTSSSFLQSPALNIPLQTPLRPCLETGKVVAKEQALTPAVSANADFLRTVKSLSSSSFGSGGGGGGGLIKTVDASLVQYGQSPVPESIGWSVMGGKSTKVIDSTSLLDTRVISFKLLSQSGQKLDVRDAASPMTLLLPLKNPLVTSSSSSIVSSYDRLSFNITCPGISGLEVDDKKTSAVEFLHVLKSSATSFTSTSTVTSKAITSLSIVSRNLVTGQSVVSVPCGGPIGIRNITCKGGNSSYILIYDCPSISLQPICAFWNETLNAWSSSGCFLAKYDRESISCSCNHTTKFAARFVALADMQEDLFSTESLAALAKPEELLRLYPHVFIIIGIITAFVLLSSIITYDLDVRASRLFYETLRTDPEIKFLERIETLKGNVFFLDRVMDDKIYANQDKISRARLQRQAKDIADRNGWHYTGYREVLPSGININKFDWTPKKLPTYLISNLFCCCGTRSLNYEVAAEKRLQAPVMQSNPMQRMNRALPVAREDEKTSTITSVTISSSSFSSGEGGGGASPSTKTGWLKRLTHDYTRAIYSRVKGAFDNFKVSANSNFPLFSKAAGIPSSIVEEMNISSKENESFEDLLEPGKQENIEELLQEIQAASTWTRFIKLRGFLMRTWVLYVLFNHPYFSIFSKYDPRNPRYLRMLQLSILLIGNLWTTTFLFSFVNEGGGVRTIPETILVALLSCLLQVPISMITAIFFRNASVAEFDSRYPYIAAELRRRARVEDFLGKMSKKLLEAEFKNVASDDFKHFTHSQIMSSLEGGGLPTLSNNINKTVATTSTATTMTKKKVLVKKMMKKKKSTLSGNIPASDSSPMNSSHRALHNHDPDHETSDDDFDQKIMSHSRRMLVRDLNDDDDDDDDFDKEIHDHTSQHHHHKHNHEHQQRDHHHQGRHQHHHHSDHHLTRKSHFGPIMKNQAKHGAVDDDDDDNNDEFGNSTNGKNDDKSSRNKDNDLKDSEDVHLAVASDFEVATKIEADEEEEEEEEVEVEEEIEVPSEHVDPNKDLKHEDDFSYGWINAPQDLQQHCPWMLWCCGRHPSQRDAYIAKMKKLEEDQRALLEKKKKEAEEKRRNNLLKKKKRKTFFGRKGKEKKETVKENAVEEHAAHHHHHHHHHDEKNSTGNAGSVISQDAALAGRNAATTAVGVGALSQSSSSSSSTGQSRDDHDQDHDHDLDHGRVIKDDLGDYNGSGTDTGDESLSYLLWFFSPIVAFCCKSTRRVERVQTVESFESIIQKSRRNLSTAKNSNSSSDGSLNDEGGKSNKVETQDTILRQAHSRFSSVSILPCTVSMLIAITISCLVLGFQIFYISLFGFRNDDKVTLSLTITWALSQGWSLFVVEPGMSFVDLIITFVIRPAWLPYFLWIPYVGPIVAGKVASDMVSQDGKTILSGRMQNLTLVRAAGAASQLSPELAVVAYGFGAVISATLSNVEDKLLILSTKKKKKKKTTSTSATKSSTLGGGDDNDDDEEDHHHHHHYDHHRHLAHKLSQRQRHELIVHRYILAQLHSVEEAQRNRNVLAEKLAKAASVKGWRRIGRTTKTMHDPTILQLHHEHHQSEPSTK
jgi:hypothetical protein